MSVGLSSIAEFQIDGGFHNRLSISNRNPAAPLASLVTATGDVTSDVEDIVIATKIRVLGETPSRPALGLRFATKLPNATNESGLGLDTTDFYVSLLGAKTVQSVRVVANLGAGILSDPTVGNRQNDVLTYGVSFARAVTQAAEIVGELNGRVSTRTGDGLSGHRDPRDSQGRRTLHARQRAIRCRVFFGLTSVDPTIGVHGRRHLRLQRLHGALVTRSGIHAPAGIDRGRMASRRLGAANPAQPESVKRIDLDWSRWNRSSERARGQLVEPFDARAISSRRRSSDQSSSPPTIAAAESSAASDGHPRAPSGVRRITASSRVVAISWRTAQTSSAPMTGASSATRVRHSGCVAAQSRMSR